MLGRPSPVSVAVRSMLLAAGLLGGVQLSGLARPVDLLSPARTGQGSEVILHDFGPEGIREGSPFDGQYIYVTARLLPDLEAIADQIYESDFLLVRILHPLLASPAPQGNPTVVLLQVWNVLGLGLFVWALADLLQRHGFPVAWAWAGTVACGCSLILTTSEPLAFGLGMAGLALVDRDRLLAGTVLLALGGLGRETALTFAVAAGVLLATRHRRVPAAALVVAAVLPTAAWWAYVQSITERSRVPAGLFGIVHLPGQWAPHIAASLLVLGCIAVSVLAWRDVPALRWLALGFAAWIPLLERYSFTMTSLPRLALPSVALGIAGLFRWRSEQRGQALPAPPVCVPTRVAD